MCQGLRKAFPGSWRVIAALLLLAGGPTGICQEPADPRQRAGERPRLSELPASLTLASAELEPEAQTNTLPRRTLAEAQISRNPLADAVQAITHFNFNFGAGPEHDQDGVAFNFQPQIPFHLTEDWNLLTRTFIPFFIDPGARPSGIGDSQISLWPSPAANSSFHWGFGPTIVFPTATEPHLGTGKFSAGPSAVAAWLDDPWLLSAILQDVWSFAGSGSRPAVHRFMVYPRVNYGLGHRWYLTSSPVITADWEADSNNRWLVPVGGGLGKIILIRKLPVDLTLQAFSNVVRPQTGPDWQLRFAVNFVFAPRPEQPE